jgi:hypothetical protein
MRVTLSIRKIVSGIIIVASASVARLYLLVTDDLVCAATHRVSHNIRSVDCLVHNPSVPETGHSGIF